MTTPGTILVVDDTPQNLMVAKGHLETAGYTVTTAASGERALAVLADHVPDLVVLDVLMPGLGGFETCRRIRAAPRVALVPVLFLTALGDREVYEPALAAGADDLLAKPFNRSELLLRVGSLIRQYQRARSAARLGEVIEAEHAPAVARLVARAHDRADTATEIAAIERVVATLRALAV